MHSPLVPYRTWSVYFNDAPSTFFLTYPRRHLHKVHKFDKFYTDAAAGNLANLVFLEPRYNNHEELGLPSQDQEPPHNVGQGDRLIKSVYEALRASPQWNRTLFVLTYDEVCIYAQFASLSLSLTLTLSRSLAWRLLRPYSSADRLSFTRRHQVQGLDSSRLQL